MTVLKSGKKTLAKGLVALAFAMSAPAAQAADLQYKDLPAAAKAYVEEVRNSCKDSNPDKDPIPADPMAGILPITLSDGTPALLLDNNKLCADQYTGANCSNRGCDSVIMTEAEDKSWKEIFHEHLYEKRFHLDENKQLKSIVAFVYAGDPHCGNPPEPKLESSEACQVSITYENKAWSWKKIPDQPALP